MKKRTNRTKRMIVAILAAAVIAAAPAANIVPVLLTASAADVVTLPEKTNLKLVTEKGNLTVQIPDNVSNSYTVKAYEMLQLVIAKDSKWTDGTKMTNDENSKNIYVVTDKFKKFFETAKNAYTADDSELPRADKLYLYYDAAETSNCLQITNEESAIPEDTDYIEIDNEKYQYDTKENKVTHIGKLDETYFEASIISKLTGSNVNPTETEASAVRLFSDWATRYIKAKGTDMNLVATTAKKVKSTETEYTFEFSKANPEIVGDTDTSLVYGYYVIVTTDTNSGNEGSVINQSILNVPQAANVKLKASPITVDKSVDNLIDANRKNNGEATLKKTDSTKLDDTEGGDKYDKITANIGDVLQYKVESHIPALTSYVLNEGDLLGIEDKYELTEDNFTETIKDKFVYTFRDTMINQDFIPVDTKVSDDDVSGFQMVVTKADENKTEVTYVVVDLGKDGSHAYYIVDEGKKTTAKESDAIGRLWETDYVKTVKTIVEGEEEKKEDVYQNFFAINFDLKELKKEGLDGGKVVFTYNAELKGEAGNNDATNTATFTYSNDPYDNTSTDTIEHKNEVYTYDLKVDKLFSDGAETKDLYSKVKFKLYSQDSSHKDRTAIRFKYTDGIYVRVDSDDKSTEEYPIDDEGIIAVDENGKLRLHGLGEGTYYLEEQNKDNVLSDAGYNKVNPIKITISAKDDEIIDSNNFDLFDNDHTAVTAELDGVSFTPGKIGGSDEYGIEFKVVNQKGFKLPFTGEFGNWALAISGILLVAVGGTVIVLVNRKKKDSPTDNEK